MGNKGKEGFMMRLRADSYLGKGVILGEWRPVNRKINGHPNRNKQQKKYLTRLQLFKNGLSNIFQHLPTISDCLRYGRTFRFEYPRGLAVELGDIIDDWLFGFSKHGLSLNWWIILIQPPFSTSSIIWEICILWRVASMSCLNERSSWRAFLLLGNLRVPI